MVVESLQKKERMLKETEKTLEAIIHRVKQENGTGRDREE